MKQNLADPSFGLDGKIQAVLSILSTQEPSWAEFNEQAQMFEVSFRSGIYYEDGLDPQVWLAMFSSMVPRGPCLLLTVGVDMQGQIKVEPWGFVEDFPERTSLDPEWRTLGELAFFKEILQAVHFIERTFKEHYEMATFKEARHTRLALVD